MYMLGRLRTASSPSRTVMALASYAGPLVLGALVLGALADVASGALSGSGRFSGLTSDTVLLLASCGRHVVRARPWHVHRGASSGVGHGKRPHQSVAVPRGSE